MKIRDEFVNAIQLVLQNYTKLYSQPLNDMPQARQKDIQDINQFLQEKNPVKLRKALELKLNALPSGFLLFFMSDLKKLKHPLLELLSTPKYQKANLKIIYQNELSKFSQLAHPEGLMLLVGKINQLESTVATHEKRTQYLEVEVKKLAKENEYLTQTVLKLYEQNQQLQKERNEALLATQHAQSKVQNLQEQHTKFLAENRLLKDELDRIKPPLRCRPETFASFIPAPSLVKTSV